ncbi:tyrosine recombinase XerS [Neobacillus sp. YIM B02564]|uniref:Tyrosine recombinase XerS n=1 Tax=Neobacillus paridis TaxID=2803862 RepID=A0ABS1TLQ4_9BACI|nr:tyrosine recombinase XerS [Neobacillus paridis]MBL4952098.1 tyrosine recombinase XerS [Neobacillus paridis]
MKNEQQQLFALIEEKVHRLPYYVGQYVEYKEAGDRAKPNTLLSYLYDYERFFSFLTEEGYYQGELRDVPLTVLETLKREDIDKYLLFLKKYSNIKKRTSRNRMLSSLKSLFHYLSQIEEDDDGFPLLKRNIMAKIEIKGTKPSPQAQADALKGRVFTSRQEIQDFLDFVALGYAKTIKDSHEREPVKKRLLHYYSLNMERDLAILSLILGSGLRIYETVSLDVSDIDWKERAVRVVRKGKEDKTLVHFSESALAQLESYLAIRDDRYHITRKQEPALFVSLPTGPNKQVGRLTKRAAQEMIGKYTKWYGRSLSAHNLRHSFATVHWAENQDVFGLQSQLGHSNPQTTQRYALIFNDTLREMIDKMDKNDDEPPSD